MLLRQRRSRFRHGHLLAILAIAGGCGRTAAPTATSPVEARLELIAELLAGHIVESGRRPASEVEFRDYVDQHGRERMEALGIAGTDELLTSPRDGRKFVILYEGRQAAIRGEIWAYEAEGREGTRAVVDSVGRVRPMPEEDFQRMLTDG
jgi:hypothetical protein